jgi:hypothetical protein
MDSTTDGDRLKSTRLQRMRVWWSPLRRRWGLAVAVVVLMVVLGARLLHHPATGPARTPPQELDTAVERAGHLLQGTEKEQAEGIALLRNASTKGYPRTALVLGTMMATGKGPVEKRSSTARTLLKRAVDAGLTGGYRPLGELYLGPGGPTAIGGRQLGCGYLYRATRTGDRTAMQEFLSQCRRVQIHESLASLAPMSRAGPDLRAH